MSHVSHCESCLTSKRALRCGGVRRSESCRTCILGAYALCLTCGSCHLYESCVTCVVGAYQPCRTCLSCLLYESCVTCASCLTCVVAERSIVRALRAIERERGKRDNCVYYKMVQTHDVGLLSLRHPLQHALKTNTAKHTMTHLVQNGTDL